MRSATHTGHLRAWLNNPEVTARQIGRQLAREAGLPSADVTRFKRRVRGLGVDKFERLRDAAKRHGYIPEGEPNATELYGWSSVYEYLTDPRFRYCLNHAEICRLAGLGKWIIPDWIRKERQPTSEQVRAIEHVCSLFGFRKRGEMVITKVEADPSGLLEFQKSYTKQLTK